MAFGKRKIRELISPRVGFHYFPDFDHYTGKDLSTWLPILIELKASWLVLESDGSRAVPEQFINGLVTAGITPIIHLKLPLPNAPSPADLKSILLAYSRWGVKHIILFDRPNTVQSWSSASWAQQDLVERFLDRFLPLAAAVAQSKITPIFPPLEPGGGYWDISFLKQSIQSMQRRGFGNLLKQISLASYSFSYNHELGYGKGGPAKWPKSLPYVRNEDGEDQRGFNNYEWLQAAARSVYGREFPVYMLGAGAREPGVSYSPEVHAGVCLNILEKLSSLSSDNPIPDYVKCCNFYLLSAEMDSEAYPNAWFKSADNVVPIVDLLRPQVDEEKKAAWFRAEESTIDQKAVDPDPHPIDHYLLLPRYEWGISDFHLEATRPFIQKYHPTVGFSLEEAALARQVTVIGGETTFPEDLLNQWRSGGSVVDRISGDGTSIATQLQTR